MGRDWPRSSCWRLRLRRPRSRWSSIAPELLSKLGLKDASAPLDPAVKSLEAKHAQLRLLFKTLSSEILHLQGDSEIKMPGAENEAAVKVAETKRRALDLIRASGAID